MTTKPILVLALAAALAAPLSADLGSGLAAYYPFDGDALDQSGNLNDGIEFGGIAYAVGIQQGQAVSLDGVDDYVQLPRVVESDFSVAFWVKTTASAPAGTWWWEGLGLVDGEVCGSPAGGDWGIALLSGGHVCWWGDVSTSEVNDGAWHSVILTRDMSQDHAVIYVDGLAETSGAAGTTPFTGPPWLGVGNNPCDVSFGRLYFPGLIDELRFYDRVLTGDEIQQLGPNRVFSDGFESGDATAWSGSTP